MPKGSLSQNGRLDAHQLAKVDEVVDLSRFQRVSILERSVLEHVVVVNRVGQTEVIKIGVQGGRHPVPARGKGVRRLHDGERRRQENSQHDGRRRLHHQATRPGPLSQKLRERVKGLVDLRVLELQAATHAQSQAGRVRAEITLGATLGEHAQ